MRNRNETREERTEGEMLQLLRDAYDLRFFSAEDLAGYQTFTAQRIHTLLKGAERYGLVAGMSEGRTFGLQRRYTFTHKGVQTVRTFFDLPLKAHLAQAHQEESLDRLRLYEPIMRLAPRLFRSGAVQTPCVLAIDPDDDPRAITLDGTVALDEFTWLQATKEVPRHGLARYRTKRGHMVWFLYVTVGLHHGAKGHRGQSRTGPRLLHHFSVGLDSVPAFRHGLAPAAPSGVIFVVLDRLAGLYVQRRYPYVPKAIVDAEGNIIERLLPVPPTARFLGSDDHPGPIGLPEEQLRRLEADPQRVAMRGTPQRKTFEYVNSYPGLTRGRIAEGVGHPVSVVSRIVQTFVNAGLMVYLDGGVYLSAPGRATAGLRDRLNPNVVHQLMAGFTAEDPSHRRRLLEHDRQVATLAARFKRLGIEAYPGWRLEIHYSDNALLRPDLWALIPLGNGLAMWHAVEVERSASAESEIDRRVGNYRRAQETGDLWPQLWVVGKGTQSKQGRRADDAVASRYVTRCGDLPLLVIQNYLALGKDLTALKAFWQRLGATVPIDYLTGYVDRQDLLVDLQDRVDAGFPKTARRRE